LIDAAKKAASERGESVFLGISKADENGRFKQTLTVPKDKEVVRELIDVLSVVSHTPLS
jgi:hypothetical protein